MRRMGGWRLTELPGDESGQAAVEYAILGAMTALLLVGLYEMIQIAVLNYYYDTASLICLPIP